MLRKHCMLLVVLNAQAIAAQIPPIDDVTETALSTAVDGRDHQESAFRALVDHVATWTDPDPGGRPIVLAPDVGSMVSSPDGYRGQLVRITGVLAHVEQLPAPFADVTGWIVRLTTTQSQLQTPDDETARGIPVFVYLPDASDTAAPQPIESFKVGDQVSLPARFYKRIDRVARDGVERSYASFVGRYPRPVDDQESPERLLPVISAMLGGMLFVFVLLLVWSRRSRGGGDMSGVVLNDVARYDEPESLPEDPAKALAILRGRANSGDEDDADDHRRPS